jgi:hypothetical protein
MSNQASDPFESALEPPPDEPPPLKLIREEKERVAKSISDAIDEALRVERSVCFSACISYTFPDTCCA